MSAPLCPLCAQGGTKIAERPHFEIFSCTNCGLEFASETQTSVNATHPEYYDMTIQSFERQVEDIRRILPRRIEEFTRLLGRKPRNVLEIGCGSGAYAIVFEELGLAYTGIEYDPEMAKFAAERTGKAIWCGDFLESDVEGPFDLIYFTQVLEHVGSPAPFLAKVAKLAAGGLVHIDVPNQKGLAAFIRKRRNREVYGSLHYPYHMIGYDRASLTYALEEAGFDIVKMGAHANNLSLIHI